MDLKFIDGTSRALFSVVILNDKVCVVLCCPYPPPIFKIYISEKMYETESSFQIILSDLKMSGQ